MTPIAKVGLVVAGYAVGVVVASAAVAAHVAATSGPDRQTYGAMYAFGDDVLFLAVFGVAGVPATGAALFFLRPYRSFWRLLSAAALGIAATGLAALVAYVAPPPAHVRSMLHDISDLSPLRLLLSPLFGPAFVLAGLFAPNRSSRIAFLVATVVEATVFAYVALVWFLPLRSH